MNRPGQRATGGHLAWTNHFGGPSRSTPSGRGSGILVSNIDIVKRIKGEDRNRVKGGGSCWWSNTVIGQKGIWSLKVLHHQSPQVHWEDSGVPVLS